MQKIGIIGMGIVGGALYNWFPQAKIWDKYKPTPNTKEEVFEQDIIFICINLLDDGLSEKDIKTFDEIIKDIPKGKIIINKITVVPGFTDYFAQQYPYQKFYHNPEFLTEANADYDFLHPPFQILGITKTTENAFDILNMLPLSPFTKVISARNSEMFKLVRNAFLSSKVILANQIYDICQATKCDYNIVRDLFKNDIWIGGSHSQIWHKGYRGYAGKCLPKDLDALIKFARKNKFKAKLFENIKQINAKYITYRQSGQFGVGNIIKRVRKAFKAEKGSNS